LLQKSRGGSRTTSRFERLKDCFFFGGGVGLGLIPGKYNFGNTDREVLNNEDGVNKLFVNGNEDDPNKFFGETCSKNV